MIEDCMCCYTGSLIASVAALCKSFHAKESSIYTFASYETVRCKSYLSSFSKSVIVNVSF